MSRSEALGEAHEVRLEQATIRYRERGSGPPAVFVHGLLVNGDHWRKVVPELAGELRCITPDWPLGAHELAADPDADLSPPGLARLIADFLAALDLEGVTLVANDTGGALAQLVVTRHPERIGRLVLTPCDAYRNFLPLAVRHLEWVAPLPGSMFAIAQTLRVRPLRRLPIAFGWLTKRPIERDLVDSYVRPIRFDRAVRRDLRKILRGISPRYTLEAAEKLAGFDRPALIVWAREDRLFPHEHAEKLAATLPNARLETVEDSYSFVPEDQPEALARAIAGFVREG